jgi:hypothetical protein
MKRLALTIGLFWAWLAAFGQPVRTFDTLGNLLALKPIEVASETPVRSTSALKATVILRGLLTVNDGRGGSFYWDGDSTTATNTYNVFKHPTLTTGRWKRIGEAPAGTLTAVGGAGYFGQATLVDGTYIVTNALVTTNSLVFLTAVGANRTNDVAVTTQINGKFTILSGALDSTAVVNWFFINPSQ